MKIFTDSEEILGVVKFPYRGFEISLQNQFSNSDLVIFGGEDHEDHEGLQLGEYTADVQGIRQAMKVIDHFVINKMIKERGNV